MKTWTSYRAFQATLLGLLAVRTLAQTATEGSATTATVELGTITTLACYSKPDPLTQDNTDTFQTSGSCQKACGNAGFPVMAITGGSTCYCGNMLPAADLVVDDSKCDAKCNGYDQETCGGIGYWQVYLDGLSGNVEVAPNSTVSSVSAGPSSTTASATRAPETVVVTASSSAKPSSKPSGVAGDGDDGPNKIGIAVGVVVGVLVLAAVTGGAIFFMKQRRRKHIEEEHKAQAINSFPGSRSSDTKSDARLDPSVASSYRRESIGSIADERDFSRRILQVTNNPIACPTLLTVSQVRNPDNRGSLQSVA